MSVLGQFCLDRDRRHNLEHVSDGSWEFQGQNVRDELYFVSLSIWGAYQRESQLYRILFTLLDQEQEWLYRNKSRNLLWDQLFSHGLEFQCHWVEIYLQVDETLLSILYDQIFISVRKKSECPSQSSIDNVKIFENSLGKCRHYWDKNHPLTKHKSDKRNNKKRFEFLCTHTGAQIVKSI